MNIEEEYDIMSTAPLAQKKFVSDLQLLKSHYLEAVYSFIDYLKKRKDYDTITHVCRTALEIDAFSDVQLLKSHRLETVNSFIGYLKRLKDYDTIIHVCHTALEIDAFDEVINIELMYALKEDGQRFAALMRYQQLTYAYYKHLGVAPPERILNVYKDFMNIKNIDIDTFRQNLEDGADKSEGALVCDYSVFRHLCYVQRHNVSQQSRHSRLFLALVTLYSGDKTYLEPFTLDGIMNSLLEILRGCLRCGDAISRYSSSQYVILLSMMNHACGDVVMARTNKLFYKKYGRSKIKITFDFALIGDIDPERTTV